MLQVTFESLYPTLRSTIIDQITDDIPEGVFHDTYLPVKFLLGLSDSALKEIMEENENIWPSEEVPDHLQKLKAANPNAAIDPETPPARRLVRAIVFLQQQHLPASLLGEWQFPLPSTQVFMPPVPTPVVRRRF